MSGPHGYRRSRGTEGGRVRGSEGRGSWGLRGRLTFAFAFVALAAVGLTVWLTLGAVFQAQRDLFEPPAPATPSSTPPASPDGRERNEGSDGMAPPASPATREPADGSDRTDAAATGVDGREQRHFAPWWLGRGGSPPWTESEHGGWGERDWNDPEFAAARNAFLSVSRTAFLSALISFLLAVAAASVVTRFLTRPLAALTDGAERLGSGERGLRLPLPSADDELRRLTTAFNELVAGLERQEAWRRDMVADVAHDLRTPLSVLRSEIEAMQDGVSPVDDAALRRLHREVMMLARLVDDLRTLSLAESSNLALDPQPTPLHPFLVELAESFAGRAAESGARVEVTRVPAELSAVFDRLRMRQVMGNLVENALTHGGSGVVETGADGTEVGVRLWVRDHGPGLTPEARTRIFERFYRGDQSRTRAAETASGGEGTGLGLAIARALVELHGGRLDAENHADGGAIFVVTIPQRTPAA